MIEIYTPNEEEIHTLQHQESAFYWSSCADMLFRKHGFIDCVKRPSNAAPKGIAILSRGTQPQYLLDTPAIVEGPVSATLLSALNIEAEIRHGKSITIHNENKNVLGEFFYRKFSVKRIPSSKHEKTEPYLYSDQNLFWNNDTIKVQIFKPTGIWYPALYARIDGDESPLEVIGVTDGKRLIIGAPIFDILLHYHSMPALEDGFYKIEHGTYLFYFEQWLMHHVCNLAEQNNITLKRAPAWPQGRQTGLTIRHDYDRPISDSHLENILQFYRDRNIKSTWFLLVDKPPTTNQIDRMIEEGHEVALHSIAPYFEDFKYEVSRFQALTGVFPLGYTCHGGIGSRGQLALTQHLWSENLGLLYGEMIGISRGLPHPVLKPICGSFTVGRLILQNAHNSLDLGMKPEAHQLDHLTKEIPPRLVEGGHVILMNHPDIHWPELQTLIDRLDLSNIWLCTMEEAARWMRASRFAFNGYAEDVMEHCYPTDKERYEEVTLKKKLKDRSSYGQTEKKSSSQILSKLEEEIIAWFDRETPHANPTAKAATIKTSAIDLPMRVDHLIHPLKEKLNLTQSFDLLDIGCGYGGMPIFLAQKYPHARITAIDTSDRFFTVGQQVVQDLDLNNLSFSVSNMLDLADHGVYDIIIASNVMNYLTSLTDLENACSKIMHALKPGGWVIIHTPHFWSYKEPFTQIPFLQFLPIKTRERVSRRFNKRPSFQDVRLPSFFELTRFFNKYGGLIKHHTHKSLLSQFMSTHLTLWVERYQ
jgi:cyclopropane fatty-acyl-phospholipid synthase-like methyltransferase